MLGAARAFESPTTTALVSDGFQRLDLRVGDDLLIATMDGYAKAIAG